MLFGEIVEPSTRALVDDEYEEYPEFVSVPLKWKNNVQVPSSINQLIFVETIKIKTIFQRLLLKDEQPICALETKSIVIYKLQNNDYVISYTPGDVTTGALVEELAEWIRKAKSIYTISSESISSYLNSDLTERPETLLRMLKTDKSNGFGYKKLESPNLISGLGASVLTYCLHTGLQCSLFVIYMDPAPLDTVNTSQVIDLMRSLNLCLKTGNINVNSNATGNLYL